jgi:lysine-specific demethylase 8
MPIASGIFAAVVTIASSTSMPRFRGPAFTLVDEIAFEDFEFGAGVAGRTAPLLVKGAVRHWPAWDNWAFDKLATQCEAADSGLVSRFQTGLTEQGATRPARHLAVAPYLRALGEAALTPPPAGKGLFTAERRAALATGESFFLDWSRMDFTPDRLYLQQWNMLAALPHLRADFPMRRLWPGLRKTWEYAFIGPADTLSGLHCDFPNNWFCQVRGVKEFILFTREQSSYMFPASKYDWGATLSEVDISRLDDKPQVRERFAQARGLYARVEAGDALYIPKRTWHAVVSLSPSVSIGIFGLTPFEIATGGLASELRNWLHLAHLYRWRNCTCHPARETK